MIESVKWVAVIAMLIEHADRYVLGQQYPIAYYIGRIAFPLFAIALGVSLAGRDQASMTRAVKRTCVWAVIAQVASWTVRDPAPWNVLFVLAAGILIVSQIERRTWWVVATLLVSLFVAPFAEFSVSGVIMAAAGVWFGRHRNGMSTGFLVFAILFLQVENANPFALLALPVLAMLALVRIQIPRIPNAMQWVYAGQFPLFAAARVFV